MLRPLPGGNKHLTVEHSQLSALKVLAFAPCLLPILTDYHTPLLHTVMHLRNERKYSLAVH